MALPPRSTGTLSDSIEQLPDLVPVRPTQTDLAPAPSLGETFSAARRASRADRSDFDEITIRDGYAPILEGLGLDRSQNPIGFSDLAAGAHGETALQSSQILRERGADFMGSMTNRSTQERLIAERIRERRSKDPSFLPGVPDTVPELRKYFLENEKKKRLAAQQVTERATGFGGFMANLGGSATEMFHDPLNIITLPVGGGGRTALGIFAREALVNGALEALNQPIVAANRAELGDKLTTGEAIANVGTAALFGGLLETTIHVGAKHVGGPAYDKAIEATFNAMPASVQRRWADKMKVGNVKLVDVLGDMDNRELAAFARSAITPDKMTPDEQAALNTLERDQDVAEASPFAANPAGNAKHAQSLADAINDLTENRRPRDLSPANDAGARATAPERPPVATSTVTERPQSSSVPVQQFKQRVRVAESGGDDAADNPLSSADGRYQITDGTFRSYFKRLFGRDPGAHPDKATKNNPEAQERIMDALTGDYLEKLTGIGEYATAGKLYLLHFAGTAGGAKILKADPDTPIERILTADAIAANPFLKGKSASQVIAWAHEKMGGSAASVPPRSIGGELVSADDPRIAELSNEALRLEDEIVGLTRLPDGSPVNLYTRNVSSSAIGVDATRFQFKSGGDEFGVTDRLKGIKEWDAGLAGRVTLWEDNAGKLWIADGHQRHGLARRISAESGADIGMDAMVLRERDGISAEDARVWAALKNIAEGTGTAVDAAKVLRDAGEGALDRLPPKSPLVRDGAAISRLSDDAFGAVYNERIPADQAAVIGELLPDNPETHLNMVDLLIKLDPANRAQARSIVRQAIAAGFHSEEQIDLFGSSSSVASLFAEKAKLLERGLARLRKMRLVHKTAANEADELERKGSKIARSQSEKEAQANAEAIAIVDRLAYRAGPVADALTDAARDLAGGGRLGDAADRFVNAIRELDLRSLEREAPADARGGPETDGAGRESDVAEAHASLFEEPSDQEQPSLIELEAATSRFSDPDGPAIEQQADSLAHDFKAALYLDDPEPIDPAVNARELAPVDPAPVVPANDPLPDLEPHLDDADRAAIAAAYELPEYDGEASRRFVDDFTTAIAKGLEHVTEAVREIIRKVQHAVLAAAVVLNPAGLGEVAAATRADFAPAAAVRLADLPEGAAGQMTAAAQLTYRAMADRAKAQGKGFIIADKPGGRIHVFAADGKMISSAPALYGKNAGDVAGDSVTPAGTFELEFGAYMVNGKPVADMGPVGYLKDRASGEFVHTTYGTVGVHRVVLAHPEQNRLGRLASESAADNKISNGCINTSEETFVQAVAPNVDELNGGLIFVLPEDPAAAAAMFPAEKMPLRSEGGVPFAPPPRTGETALPRRESETGIERRESVDFSPDADRIIAAQKGASLEELVARATDNQAQLADVAKTIELATGAKFLNPGAKTLDRVREKFDSEGYSDPSELKDLARGGFVVDSVEQAQRVAEFLTGNFEDVYDKGWRRIAGYYDRKLIVRFKNGGVAEIQLIPSKIADYKMGRGHELYQIARDPKTAPELVADLTEEMRLTYSAMLEGSEFAADGKAFAKSGSESSVPSSGALRATAADATHLPDENTSALSGSVQATGRSSSSKNLMASTSANALDMGQMADPGKAARDRELIQLGAAAPMRPAGEQPTLGEIGLELFDSANQGKLTFRLDEEGGEISAEDLLAELDADKKAIDTLRGCL